MSANPSISPIALSLQKGTLHLRVNWKRELSHQVVSLPNSRDDISTSDIGFYKSLIISVNYAAIKRGVTSLKASASICSISSNQILCNSTFSARIALLPLPASFTVLLCLHFTLGLIPLVLLSCCSH